MLRMISESQCEDERREEMIEGENPRLLLIEFSHPPNFFERR